MNALANAEHYVYRLYDNQERLIYVGCSYQPVQRIQRHRRTMWWAPQIAKIQTTVYPTRKSGLAAETEARTFEAPRWNIESRWRQRFTWTEQTTRDYITALENHPNFKTTRILDRIAKAKKHLALLRTGGITPMKIQAPAFHDAVKSFRHPGTEAA